MAGVNKVILLGHLGKDPEMRYTTSGRAVVNFSLATTERWTNKADGEVQKRTEWHNIVFWDRQAEVANQYLRKGSSCYIEGRITNRTWDDKDGGRHYRTEIVGTALQLLSGNSRDSGPRNEPLPPPDEYFDSYSEPVGIDVGGASAPVSSAPPEAGGDDLPF